MSALVIFRQCVSNRIARTRDAERQARDLGSQKLISLTAKHTELQQTHTAQLTHGKRLEVSIVNLQESEQRLKEHVTSLEAQREADRDAAR